MINKNGVNRLLSKMTEDVNSNLKEIKYAFGNLNYTDEDNQSIFHILVDNKYDEEKCFLAIKTLLQIGLIPNLLDDFDYNFVQTALYTGYSEDFILKIISEALKYNLNVNHVDSDKDTILHTAIYSDDYLGGIERIYDLLCSNGFDSTLKDHEGRDLVQAMVHQKQYSRKQISGFRKKFDQRCSEVSGKVNQLKEKSDSNIVKNVSVKVPSANPLLNKASEELSKYGRVLNEKKYHTAPTVGRDKELNNLMITLAQEKKRPLIVGESGVGKTAIVDELAFRIKNGQVPAFLQGKIIFEVNPSDIVAGCKYTGMFEYNMTKLMKLCEKYDVILFIDEIHTIYGIGSCENKNNDMASMLKFYIDRTTLKVIGTTTEKEYNDFFSNDALKRRFEKITINEPTEELLYQILDKVIGDYYVNTGITFADENIRREVINVIIDATSKGHRVYTDMVNNPDLAISIIDKAFAFARVYDSNFITEKHFSESFEYCDRIYEPSREKAIMRLNNLEIRECDPHTRILKLDFGRLKK